ncbi:hypothetical protein LCGC14_1917320 [marine sediment metagenome]|uniref:Uncharacterized protein n=1 Tax=marine sediment metagenome TaxID=412755 RepID=A0A0F9IPK8_9ZZZZ
MSLKLIKIVYTNRNPEYPLIRGYHFVDVVRNNNREFITYGRHSCREYIVGYLRKGRTIFHSKIVGEVEIMSKGQPHDKLIKFLNDEIVPEYKLTTKIREGVPWIITTFKLDDFSAPKISLIYLILDRLYLTSGLTGDITFEKLITVILEGLLHNNSYVDPAFTTSSPTFTEAFSAAGLYFLSKGLMSLNIIHRHNGIATYTAYRLLNSLFKTKHKKLAKEFFKFIDIYKLDAKQLRIYRGRQYGTEGSHIYNWKNAEEWLAKLKKDKEE